MAEYTVCRLSDAGKLLPAAIQQDVAPGPNLSSFSNPGYDRAYEASRFLQDGPARLRHFKAMNDILADELPLVVTRNSMRFGLTQKWVSNFKRNLLVAELPFLDVDMARKKKGP